MQNSGTSLPRPVTLKEVAREAGVSISTASRALSKPALIRSSIVARVRNVVEQLGYKPNLAAQNLRLGCSNVIFVVFPTLSPLFLGIFRGIERAALEMNYSVVMGHTGDDPARGSAYFERVARRADGVIFLSGAGVDITTLDAIHMPSVMVLDEPSNQRMPAVRISHQDAAKQATNHLIELGHRNIAHITGGIRSSMAIQRREGFLTAMAAAGLPDGEKNCVPGESTMVSGQIAMEILLARANRPTAVFAANDAIAVGAISAIHAAGLRVPEDISVIGHDDQHMIPTHNQNISTVHVPAFDLGYYAMKTMRQALAEEKYDREIVLPTRIIRRGSTMPPKSPATSLPLSISGRTNTLCEQH